MRKRLTGAIAAALLGAATARGATNELWFTVGERFSYRLYWGILPVGLADFWSEWVEEDGVRLVALRATARTSAVVATIYPVDDSLTSIVDPASFRPVRYEQRLNEGRHRRHDVVAFDYAEGRAYSRSLLKHTLRDLAITQECRDALCFAYYMRAKGFEAGQEERFCVVVDDKLYQLTLRGLGYETMRVPGLGKVETLRVEPQARFGEIFQKKGRVWLWFTRDRRRLCTRMVGVLPVASLKALLIRYVEPGAAGGDVPAPDAGAAVEGVSEP